MELLRKWLWSQALKLKHLSRVTSGADSVDLPGNNLRFLRLHQITIVSGRVQHSKDRRKCQLPWSTLRVTTVSSHDFWFHQCGLLGGFFPEQENQMTSRRKLLMIKQETYD